MERASLKENEQQLLIQIFPDPLESADDCCRAIMGRLPSIVVEPTDTNEVESGELRWPPEDFRSLEDFFESSCATDSLQDDNPEPNETMPLGETEAKEKTAEPNSNDAHEAMTLPCDNQAEARRD
ncbi:protein LBH-like [Heptranchias perlo]|uniref:protein LBH-like n=1 Tax=Heptranchias perlo TaxID=212740 RepID=UPI003559B628